jgi:hypothetical protein
MPIPHVHYNPPANTVEVLDKYGQPDPQWSWDGSHFRHKGHVHKPHHGAMIIGKPGTQMEGWTYNWHNHSWVEPDRPAAPLAPHPSAPPATQQTPVVVVHSPQKEESMQCTPHAHQNSLIDGLKNHPWVPIAGLAVLLISDFLTQPQPPQIPDGLPEPMQKAYIMTYQQNLAIYQERRQKLDKWGGIIFSLGTSNAALSAGNATTLQQHMAQMGAGARAAM